MSIWSTVRVLTVVFSLLVPTMVCAAPAAQMSKSEQACCKKMHGACGSMQMKHSCCSSTADRSGSPMHEAVNAQASAAVPLAPIAVLDVWIPDLKSTIALSEYKNESPPSALASLLEIAVLRI